MTKVLEFRSRAEQFRQLAAQFPNHEFREVISSMAATWENLADDRERLLPSRAADQHLAPTETVARITYAEPERDAEESRENKTQPNQPGNDERTTITLQEDPPAHAN